MASVTAKDVHVRYSVINGSDLPSAWNHASFKSPMIKRWSATKKQTNKPIPSYGDFMKVNNYSDIRKVLASTMPEGSLVCLEKSTTGSYPEAVQFKPHPQTYTL
jgi:hypothetical protein